MPITEKDEMKLKIIGYKRQGESILLTIGNKVNGFNKFAGVIDCFKTTSNFITKKLLDDYGINKLDFICWTHPDWDHTYGLSSLLKYINNNTVFILPEGVTACEIRDIIDEEKKERNRYVTEYNKIFDIIYKKIKVDKLISANHCTNLYSFRMVCLDKEYKFSMSSFAPFSKS
jgi:beta-lactamase superfamily II metal-dependent hydrolase